MWQGASEASTPACADNEEEEGKGRSMNHPRERLKFLMVAELDIDDASQHTNYVLWSFQIDLHTLVDTLAVLPHPVHVDPFGYPHSCTVSVLYCRV